MGVADSICWLWHCCQLLITAGSPVDVYPVAAPLRWAIHPSLLLQTNRSGHTSKPSWLQCVFPPKQTWHTPAKLNDKLKASSLQHYYLLLWKFSSYHGWGLLHSSGSKLKIFNQGVWQLGTAWQFINGFRIKVEITPPKNPNSPD